MRQIIIIQQMKLAAEIKSILLELKGHFRTWWITGEKAPFERKRYGYLFGLNRPVDTDPNLNTIDNDDDDVVDGDVVGNDVDVDVDVDAVEAN